MYIKLLSAGACANITIREIMLMNMMSSARWPLHLPAYSQSFSLLQYVQIVGPQPLKMEEEKEVRESLTPFIKEPIGCISSPHCPPC